MSGGKEEVNQLMDHLYRHEAGKLVAVLTGVFGPSNLELAEDVVHDSLVEAMKHWPYKGVPKDPSAWLYKVAKNKALTILNREKYQKQYVAAHKEEESRTDAPINDDLFGEPAVEDDQLRMIFTSCHPSLSKDSQIALTLKTLCGFSISEIAHAFFTTDDTINKRLVRARQKIRAAGIPFEVPRANEMEGRVEAVLETLYLVFNEGYSASSGSEMIRYELCEEAIRLAEMIAAHQGIQNKENLYALLALMFLNASRFRSRLGKNREILTLAEQDRSMWDAMLIQKGLGYMQKAAANERLSIYHILAAISACHCAAADFESTNWRAILDLYDLLLLIDGSPLVQLNRSVALARVAGLEKAIEELKQLRSDPSVGSYHLLYATEGEFYFELKQFSKAADAYKRAIMLSPLQPEKELLQKKLKDCLEKF
jgi:RNA polymerase sigma factor (sigma-70 family)